MLTVITIIVIIGLLVSLGFSTKENNSLRHQIDSVNESLETVRQEKEMVDATRQLLRNEVIVLKAQIQASASKPVALTTEEAKPKKKKYFKKKSAPKMPADKK